MEWQSSELKEVFGGIRSNENGLSSMEAKERLSRFGENSIVSTRKISAISIFIEQFTDFLVLLLIAASVVSFFVGEPVDAILILLIVAANGIFGFVQNYKAEKSIEALKSMARTKALVLGDGKKREIDSKFLVQGDVVFLAEGDKVPADCRIISEKELSVDEAPLTGESNPASKISGALPENTVLAERKNMLYMNTAVVRGKATAVVVDTGQNTEVGKMAEKLQQIVEPPTPFQVEVGEMGKKIGAGILVIVALVAIVLLFEEFLAGNITLPTLTIVMLTAISLAVAAIPEVLPAVVTLSLALATGKMLKKNSLVRKLPVVEILGSVDVICADKTGTLTENKMKVVEIFSNWKFIPFENAKGEEANKIFECGIVCNDVVINEGDEKGLIGDPTEKALVESALYYNISNGAWKRIDEGPFSSERKKMTVLAENENEKIVFMKGAAEEG